MQNKNLFIENENENTAKQIITINQFGATVITNGIPAESSFEEDFENCTEDSINNIFNNNNNG